MRFYSPETGSTYIKGVHDIPAEAIPISEKLFLSVIASPAPGKVRSHDESGLPCLIDPLPLSTEELASQERQWRDGELKKVVWLRDRHRDQLDIGAATTLIAEQFAELLVFMQALRDWPQSEAFPDKSARPLPPVFLEQLGGDQ